MHCSSDVCSFENLYLRTAAQNELNQESIDRGLLRLVYMRLQRLLQVVLSRWPLPCLTGLQQSIGDHSRTFSRKTSQALAQLPPKVRVD